MFVRMEGAGEEMTANDVVEGAQLNRKESDQSLKPDGCSMLEPSAMFIPPGTDWPKRSPQVFTDSLEGRSLNRSVSSVAGSERLCASPSSMNDAGVMVEELTLKNYKNPKLSMVGDPNSREEVQIMEGPWQLLYQLAGGLAGESSFGDMMAKDKELVTTSGREDVGSMLHPEPWVQKPLAYKQSNQNHAEIPKHLINSKNTTISNDALSPGGIRTKHLSASGFSQFFVKKTLKGKGVSLRYPGARDGSDVAVMGRNNEKAACVARVTPDVSLNSDAKAEDPSPRCATGAAPNSIHDEISLREWLKPGGRKINKVESLHIFRQIVELVDLSHSQGVVLPDIRPSCFKLLPSNRVKYVGSLAQRLGFITDHDGSYSEPHSSRKRFLGQGMHAYNSSSTKHRKISEQMVFFKQPSQFPGRSGFKCEVVKDVDNSNTGMQEFGYGLTEQHSSNPHRMTLNKSGSPSVFYTNRQQMTSVNVQLEEKWYSSPEELNERGCTFSSNTYNLGILLFELFSCFQSWEVHAAAMLDLRHRILPPIFLSENPKEAGFCLWLLHPEPSSRPTTREILQSDLVSESRDLSYGGELASSVEEDDAESELLLHFLISMKEQKQKQASKLVEDLGCLDTDIEEVEKRHSLRTTDVLSQTLGGSSSREIGFLKEPLSSEILSKLSPASNLNGTRLMKNISHLENAYFAMRSQIQLSETDATARSDIDVLKNRERWFSVQNESEEWGINQKSTDRLGAFFDGLCKYARYSKFEVCGTLRNGDLLNSANVICSLSFDRDEDYFAAAGVSKKIKIFEFCSLLNDSVDIHYPVIEMSSKSKLSCVCWNNYIKNYLASTDYDGVVQLWDVNTGQGFSQYIEHQKRAWSVDFSQLDPTKFASGSDDCSVKLWSLNEKKCIDTIRNVANVCCVQFSAHSTHLLAFGSADYKTYCYDLRNPKIPWCTLAGHGKAVSYVKFLDADTLVSASTDNTLKLWDLNKTSCSGLSTSACSLTFGGHTNEKNFVGLSVNDGYIACGSETNEVYAYYRSLPMPITYHKFGSVDPISGQETGDDNGQFVSSVCWREKSNMVVAANSSGSIKLLQMV